MTAFGVTVALIVTALMVTAAVAAVGAVQDLWRAADVGMGTWDPTDEGHAR